MHALQVRKVAEENGVDVSESIRQQIQEALHDMLRNRQSVWFG